MSNYSPRLPLQIDSTNGFSNNQTILQVVQQNLKMLLLTSPGERVMDPNFGVGIREGSYLSKIMGLHILQ